MSEKLVKIGNITGELRVSGVWEYAENPYENGEPVPLWCGRPVASVEEGKALMMEGNSKHDRYLEFWPDKPVDMVFIYSMFYVLKRPKGANKLYHMQSYKFTRSIKTMKRAANA
jgi:hypothetical protein